jgi:hypothetical protein
MGHTRVRKEAEVKLTIVHRTEPPLVGKRKKYQLWTYADGVWHSNGYLLTLLRRGETLEETTERLRISGHAYTRKVVDAAHYQPPAVREKILRQAKVEERLERGYRTRMAMA